MRFAAALAAALAFAGPAAAFGIDGHVRSSLRVTPLSALRQQTKGTDVRSCQVGDRRAKRGTPAHQTERKASAVACEQPPRSTPLTPDGIAKATAAALNVLG